MTVADLIEKLQAFPPDMQVIQFDGDWYNSGDPEPELTEHEGRTIVAL